MKLQTIRVGQEFRPPRTLTPIDLKRTARIETDVLVVGSGLAGLRAALEARRIVKRVLVVSKDQATESNTAHAQGGIAAAISARDSVERHIEDTLRVGSGLADERVVRGIITEGVERVHELVEFGVPFDQEEGRLLLAREGGHTLSRIVHQGDRTGWAVADTMLRVVRDRGIRVRENTFLIDLLVHRGRCLGALFLNGRGRLVSVLARRTILATGGAGQIYRETSNPAVTTGDGVAAAFRAGAALMDMEMIQFHPTVLYLAGAERQLITEALRGEGAILRDRNGEAFMRRYHKMGDLAPRDIVSRSILKQMIATRDTQAYLDVRRFDRRQLGRRFPKLTAICRRYNLDTRHDLIPVRPAAHHLIGGIQTDEVGRTSIRNLYAAGECACAAFHGANRLASNSLLECLVFGRRAGEHAARTAVSEKPPRFAAPRARKEVRSGRIDLADLRNSLRSLLWRHAAVERDRKGLQEVQRQARVWSRMLHRSVFDSVRGWELQNMFTVGMAVATTALARAESRGVHYRTDHPKPSRKFLKHFRLLPR
jgi:L-aspartate oxidase